MSDQRAYSDRVQNRTWILLGFTLLIVALLLVLPPPWGTLLLIGWGAVGLVWLGITGINWQLVMRLRRWLYWPLPVVTFIVLTAAAANFAPGASTYDVRVTGGLLALVGLAAIGLMLAVQPEPLAIWPQWGARQQAATAITVRRWPWALGGLLAIALLAAVNTRRFAILNDFSVHLQIALLLFALAALVYALGGDWRGWWQRVRQIPRPVVWMLALVTAVALLARVLLVDSGIRHFIDELLYVEAILELNAQPDTPLLTPFSAVTSFTWVYPYLQARLTDLFGGGFLALRLPGALFGALSIPALYLLAATVFNRRVGLAAALLLAGFGPHLHFSRIGLNNIADPLFGTLALALLARAIKHRSRPDFVLAGAALGLTQYFYEGGRLLFPPLVLCVGIGWLLYDRFATRRPLPWRGLAGFALVALAIGLPVYTTLASGGYSLASRLDTQGLGTVYWQEPPPGIDPLQHYLWRIPDGFLLYVYHHDSAWFYAGKTALVLPWLVPFLLIGAGVALWRCWRPGSLVALVWVTATVLGNSLLITLMHVARHVVVFPALMLLVALGMVVLWDWLVNLLRQTRYRGAVRFSAAGFSALVIVFALSQAVYYFGVHLPQYNARFLDVHQVMGLGAHDVTDALLRLQTIPPGSEAYIIGDYFYPPSDVMLVQQYWGTTDRDVTLMMSTAGLGIQLITARDDGQPLVFFVEVGDTATLHQLRSAFTLDGPYFSPDDTTPRSRQFALYYAVPRP